MPEVPFVQAPRAAENNAMNPVRRFLRVPTAAIAVATVVCVGALLAEPVKDVKPSSYAPAKELLSQVDEFVAQLETTLESEADYVEEAQQRVAKDAATVAVLALVLGMHDEEHRLKTAAPAVVAAARKLGASTKDYAAAKAALTTLKQSLAATGGSEKLEWKPVADVAQLMKQVPIVSNNLRRGVEGRRFDRLTDKNAGYAAALAAIAQAASADTTYCADQADEAKWRQLSTALRDAAATVRAQVRAGDQEAAVKALGVLEQSCTNCHQAFEVSK
jgi:cytochrome c556